MENQLKPIETYYNGYRFRSRLEARWAVFFDALGVKWEYEPEGFDLGGGIYYLPDFRVECWGTRGNINDKPFTLYIEIKGKMAEDDAIKIRRFAGISRSADKYYDKMKEVYGTSVDEWPECTQRQYKSLKEFDSSHWIPTHPILVLGNIPGRGNSYSNDLIEDAFGISTFNYETIDGDYFGAYPAADEKGRFYLWGDDASYIWGVDRVELAYDIARQARFEHGEKPIHISNNHPKKYGVGTKTIKDSWR